MGKGDDGSNMRESDIYIRRAELVLVSLSDSKSELDKISLSNSKPSSYFVYISTDYFYLSVTALINT